MSDKRQSLLIVDDEPTNLDILTEALEADYTVRVATDGPLALHSVSKARPDLVLLDIMMAGMDGFEVCRRLKDDPATRDIPIIFLTALAQEVVEVQGLALGAVDYITKPFNPTLVRARVRNHMDLKAYRDHLSTLVAERTLELEQAMERLSEELAQRKRAEDDLRASLEEKTALLREVHHRVRNNLQIVVSLLGLQANRIHNPEALDMLCETRNRVYSMALLHEALYRSESLARIRLRPYIDRLAEQIAKSHGRSSSRVIMENRTTEVTLPLEQAIPCGLIINELVSNAHKHAFPGNRAGSITVELDPSPGNMLLLRVLDDGVGLPPEMDRPKTSTLGLTLVRQLARQLGGELKVEPPQGAGACFCVVFPLPEDRVVQGES